MTRPKKPSAPHRERTIRDELRSVAIAPTLKRHRKRRSWPEATIAATAPEATTPIEQTVRDVLAERERVDKVNAGRTIARQYAEARSARQITAIAAEAAELLLAP